MLQRLMQRHHVDETLQAGSGLQPVLQNHWHHDSVFLMVGAVGAITRLISPYLQGKEKDPAVLVLDTKGQWVIPLLGGHSSGAEQLARELAADLGGQAVLTGACASDRRLALASFGEGWGCLLYTSDAADE